MPTSTLSPTLAQAATPPRRRVSCAALLLLAACSQRVASPVAGPAAPSRPGSTTQTSAQAAAGAHAKADAPVTLGELAATRPAATRVFLRHRIDFCCGGSGTLEEAAKARGLTAAALLAEIDAAERSPDVAAESRWPGRPASELIEHIVARYHADLRADLPHLLDLARTVDRVHAERAERPVGLPEHLADMTVEILQHLEDEEQRVFPAILAAQARRHDAGVVALERDHEALGHALARTRELTHDFTLPSDACPTWRALYAGLEDLERAIMLHAHLENNVLFKGLPGA